MYTIIDLIGFSLISLGVGCFFTRIFYKSFYAKNIEDIINEISFEVDKTIQEVNMRDKMSSVIIKSLLTEIKQLKNEIKQLKDENKLNI